MFANIDCWPDCCQGAFLQWIIFRGIYLVTSRFFRRRLFYYLGYFWTHFCGFIKQKADKPIPFMLIYFTQTEYIPVFVFENENKYNILLFCIRMLYKYLKIKQLKFWFPCIDKTSTSPYCIYSSSGLLAKSI